MITLWKRTADQPRVRLEIEIGEHGVHYVGIDYQTGKTVALFVAVLR